MAGIAKPNTTGLKKEASFKILSGVGANNQTGAGLFDGTNVDGWNANNVFYWSNSSSYVEIDIQSNLVDIWRSGVASYQGYKEKLKINKWNGTKYDDVTSLYNQVTTAISHTLWEKTIFNLPKGRYRFEYSGGLRIDSEWYIENIEPENRIFILSNNGFQKWNIEIPPSDGLSKDITSGKVYSSSSNYSASTSAEKAFDDNIDFKGSYTSNGWMSKENTGWVSVDLGVSKRIGKATLVQFGFNNLYYRCGDFKIEYSNDNVTWKTAFTGVLANNYNTQEFYFDSTGRYWRVNILNSPAGGAVGVAEIELMEIQDVNPGVPAHWETVSSTLPTKEQFNEGMYDLSILERKPTTFIEKSSQSKLFGNGKVFEVNINLKKYIDLKNIVPPID